MTKEDALNGQLQTRKVMFCARVAYLLVSQVALYMSATSVPRYLLVKQSKYCAHNNLIRINIQSAY